jgi:hypothetical protein
VKAVLVIGIAVLAGCASKSQTPAPQLSSFGAMAKAAAEGPYKIGISTEDELFAAKGTPISHTVADDGTRTDIYPGFFTHIDGASGKLVISPIPDGLPKIKMHYVYSADGILRHVASEMTTKGPNGEEKTATTDVTNGPSVTVTARKQVPSASPAAQ